MTVATPQKSKATLDNASPALAAATYEHTKSHALKETSDWLKRQHGICLSPQQLGKWAARRRAEEGSVAWAIKLREVAEASDNAKKVTDKMGSLTDLAHANLALLNQALLDAQITGSPADIKRLTVLMSLLLDAVSKKQSAEARSASVELNAQKLKEAQIKKIEAGLKEVFEALKALPKGRKIIAQIKALLNTQKKAVAA